MYFGSLFAVCWVALTLVFVAPFPGLRSRIWEDRLIVSASSPPMTAFEVFARFSRRALC